MHSAHGPTDSTLLNQTTAGSHRTLADLQAPLVILPLGCSVHAQLDRQPQHHAVSLHLKGAKSGCEALR